MTMVDDLVQQKVDASLLLLREAVARYGDRVVYASSLGSQAMVLIDLICRYTPGLRIVTLDTGRLPQQTYDLMDLLRERYGPVLNVLFPDAGEVRAMVDEHGVNLFYRAVANRKLCCAVRKVHPLQKELSGMQAWITGRRRDQANRSQITPVEDDPVYGLKKYNPMLDWTEADIWAYIRAHDLPYNSLHDSHYLSIGCACCTRAISVGEDPRSGRWWWENEDTLAECGLHVSSLARPGEGESGEGI
ncbi:phosphoadenylyl-sulfate reductase [Mariprofundus ferrooxydans]|uniref:Adenosine 5'-phosphosulfate reductase n=1 Tax=Mariprofundus ferrooxydans PV-1 TaxID=314345 RepID=Q0EZE5_9PROT|nr:phosphoadenylyl-sulfate reductase [Mariprofundus ferrooxydans]EAU54759.1 phosphoadenosine phosphosulfate reductase [Mariprofundus ferrooxydans PV-1]KON46691.1 phosphoadenosine phosphosulfate reductase [Mariprofundus ferrooxydans]